jgi:hypothetical protein
VDKWAEFPDIPLPLLPFVAYSLSFFTLTTVNNFFAAK